MKIKKVQLSEKDRRRAYRAAVRKAVMESGTGRITLSSIFRNRKKYSRKGKKHILRNEEKLG